MTVSPPLPHLVFLSLLAHARPVATVSGGVQQEATALFLPCLTLRPGTERPVILESGSNHWVAPEDVAEAAEEALPGRWPRGRPVPLWGGGAGARMAAHLLEFLDGARR